MLTYVLYLPVLGIGAGMVRRGRRSKAADPDEKRKYESDRDEAASPDAVSLFDLLSPDDEDGELDIAKAEARLKN